MNVKGCLFFTIVMLPAIAFTQLPDHSTHFIRFGQTREWSDFPAEVKDSILTISFTSTYFGVATLSLTQFDVNQTWKVILNGRHLGDLTLDEKRMVSYFDVPAGLLQKKNRLTIVPGAGPDSRPDDITISDLSVIPLSRNTLLSRALVAISVTDKQYSALPSRLTIVNENGSLQLVLAEPGDSLVVRTGVLYSATGSFVFRLPAGSYKVYASRGFEYGVDSMQLETVSQKNITHRFTLGHEVVLSGWKSVDPHVHTREHSGHGDVSMNERIITIAGEGLDYAVTTEHNKAVDIDSAVAKKGLDKWFTPITGDELTTPVGHFNIFPCTAAKGPSPAIQMWRRVRDAVDSIPGRKVVVLNHARDEHAGIRPSDSLYSRTVTAIPFNAMEVMNSGSQQADPRQLYTDWLTLMRRGIVLTPIGSSDSHDASRFIVGQSRTYVRTPGNFIDNILAGRAGVSFGLFTEMDVDSTGGSGKLKILVKVHAPSWMKPSNVMLYANDQKIFSDVLNEKDKQAGNFYLKELTVSKPPHGVSLVAIAEGPDPNVPWWPIARPYSWTSPDVTRIVLGISEAVRF